MWGDRRSAILYFEASIPFSEVKDKNKYTVEHVIPVSAAVSEYKGGSSIENLILNPVTLITRESDDLLRKAGLVKSGYSFEFPFRRYKTVDIEIKDLHGREIDCENYSMDDHFDLIHVPENPNQREFGFQKFNSGMNRHISLKTDKELHLLLMQKVPSDVYVSTACYSIPNLPMN